MKLWVVDEFVPSAGVVALAESIARTRRPLRRNPYFQGPATDHFDGRTFNPGGKPPGPLSHLLRWQLGGGRAKWPASWPSPFPPAIPDARVSGEGLRVTMVGHATLLIQVAGLNILTDPVWSNRVSPLSFAGPKRVNPPGVSFSALPPVDLVLVSHNLRPSRHAEAAQAEARPACRYSAWKRCDHPGRGQRNEHFRA